MVKDFLDLGTLKHRSCQTINETYINNYMNTVYYKCCLYSIYGVI